MTLDTEEAVLEKLDMVIIKALAKCMRTRKQTRTDVDGVIEKIYEEIGEAVPTKDAVTHHLRGLASWGIVLRKEISARAGIRRRVVYKLTSKGKKVLEQIKDIPHENLPQSRVVILEIPMRTKKIDSIGKVKSLTKYKFDDFPQPFVHPKTGETDVLLVSAHSQQEEVTCDVSLEQMRRLGIRPGNPSDYNYVPLLAYKLGLIAAPGWAKETDKKATASIDNSHVVMKTDIHVDMDLIGSHNVIAMGAGNVNSVTQKVFNDFWGGLPIHFESPSGHGCLYSELTDGSWNDQQNPYYGLLLMLPNVYTKDVDEKNRPNKVIVICAGLEIQGTQAAMLALCSNCDANGRPLKNNERAPTFAAKIVKGLVQRRAIEIPVGVRSNIWNVTSFEYVE